MESVDSTNDDAYDDVDAHVLQRNEQPDDVEYVGKNASIYGRIQLDANDDAHLVAVVEVIVAEVVVFLSQRYQEQSGVIQ